MIHCTYQGVSHVRICTSIPEGCFYKYFTLYRTADPDEMPRYVVLRLRDHSVYGYPVYTPDMRQSKTILDNRRTRIKNR